MDIKSFLASGSHNNDPAKIKAMLNKMKEKEDDVNEDDSEERVDPSDLFAKYKSKNSIKMMTSSDDDYDDDYDDYEDYEDVDDGFVKMPTLPPRTYGRGKGGSSSSLFKKFAKTNVGVTMKRPAPKDDEDASIAKDIFKKYSSSFKPKNNR